MFELLDVAYSKQCNVHRAYSFKKKISLIMHDIIASIEISYANYMHINRIQGLTFIGIS